ncbi:alpha-hydroxy acid oxidase [Pigmentiphaga soli]|uniref:Alpha-hydroxy acid oxidase n=1 Tax=Pigmentiphaga soli TaxID=1007095 RepID=A0ABP8GHU6_9BURK
MSRAVATAYNTFDFRALAKRRLPKGLFEFVDRGTEDEVALASNRAAFDQWKLVPRTLVDVSKRSAAVELFGKAMPFPLAIGPTGAAGLMWYDGEVALARAAAQAGIPFTVATGSLTSMERVAQQAGGRLWFQLYMWPQKELSYELVRRAQAAGYEALVVTVDTAVPSNREYNFRNGFSIPFRFSARNVRDVALHPRWLCSVLLRYLASTGMPQYENYPAAMRGSITAKPLGRAMAKTDSLDWNDLRELRKLWTGPLLVKGILHPDDAAMAVACGADGVIVSNHGGRMLDSSIAPLDALPGIVERMGGRFPVLLDSGIMRGSDAVKAIALGAHAVLVGRATLYGVAAGGQAGAERVLHLLHEEIRRVLGLIGCPDIRELGPRFLFR